MSGHNQCEVGKVYLVGGGTGDIELLTLKGARVLAEADVIMYDRLVNPLFLFLANSTAHLIYCGKSPQNHRLSQVEIENKMSHFALKGKRVVRLKGGDPAVFGRVAEEMAHLEQLDIEYEVVPGVTAASAASIYAGIPLTRRGINEHVTLATGHQRDKLEGGLDFSSLAQSGTLAFYMGMENLSLISHELCAKGVPENKPVAVISWGSYGRQQVVTGTLGTIVNGVSASSLTNPAMIIIGEVVSCCQKKSWFEKLPDFGCKRLLVSQRKIEWQEIVKQTSRGADVWAVEVGGAADPRMAEVTKRLSMECEWEEVVYLDQEIDTPQLLNLELCHLGFDQQALTFTKK